MREPRDDTSPLKYTCSPPSSREGDDEDDKERGTEDGSLINDAGQGKHREHLTVELCMWEEEWRLNGGQALCGMLPTELAIDLSLRQHVQSQQYRQYLMNFGKHLQNMADNQIRLFKNPLHVIEIKRWYQRQQFPEGRRL